jgi:DNA replication initiation complex subunit (GINS family)
MSKGKHRGKGTNWKEFRTTLSPKAKEIFDNVNFFRTMVVNLIRQDRDGFQPPLAIIQSARTQAEETLAELLSMLQERRSQPQVSEPGAKQTESPDVQPGAQQEEVTSHGTPA